MARGGDGGTRQRILDVAVELFATRGYAGTSMRDIAAELDVTKAALYYHFRSKDQLLDALAKPLVEGLGELGAAAAQLSEREVLTRYVALLAGPASRGLRTVFADPSAVHSLIARHDILRLATAIENRLAASPAPRHRLLARAALGAVNGAVRATMRPSRAGQAPYRDELTPDDQELLVVAALAALHAETPLD